MAKAKSDVVLISGHDGGTGASPLTSIKHAGGPWEIGLAETQQTLLLNDLRERTVVQVDGQLKTGRDVMIAALLGADEFGFATAPLVVSGCIMMRVCHLDTCPVGVATQNPELRKRFSGKARYIINFMMFVAEQVREHLAELGFRTLDEAIGQADLLDAQEALDYWKADGLDLSPIFYMPEVPAGKPRCNIGKQDHGLDHALDLTLVKLAEEALDAGTPVTLDMPIRNVNRTVGDHAGVPRDAEARCARAAGRDDHRQLHGIGRDELRRLPAQGDHPEPGRDANDYVGKGLSGGRIVVRPPPECPITAEENIIAGNVILYGATSGEMFLRGVVGERFCVRNSGAVAVVEGVGDHGCEYMTGGRAVILGGTGRNFAAGMSGGIAYVYDRDGSFPDRVNMEMVALDLLTDEDRRFLHERVAAHHRETDSAVAARLLARWGGEVDRFVKVMPNDYKRVLDAVRQAEQAGEPVMEAIMASAHG